MDCKPGKNRKNKNVEQKRHESVSTPPPAIRHLLAVFAITFVPLICYSNSLTVPFVLDDVTSILTNPLVKQFDFSLKTRIIGDITFAFNYWMGGFESLGYHAVNLILHVLNALLVYLLVQLIFMTPLMEGREGTISLQEPSIPVFIGFGAALIFAAHPLQTQAVTYTAQRVAVLAASFYLGAVLSYGFSRISASRTLARPLLALSLLLTVAAVLTKENALTIPLAILLFELTFFTGSLRRRLVPVIWYLLPLFVLPVVLLWRTGISADLLGEVSRLTAEGGAPPRLAYLWTQFPVIVSYLRLFFVPIGQNLDHDVTLRTTSADPAVIASFLVLVAIAASAVWFWRLSHRAAPGSRMGALAAFGIGWFFIALIVESGLVPLRDVMFEHRMYLPSVGLAMAVVAAAWYAASRWSKAAPRSLAMPFICVLTVAGVLLGSSTFMRNRVWGSEISLWEDAAAKSPAKARPHGSLGHAYQRSGRFEEAIASYREAVRLAPGDHVARNNLGTLYLMRKMPEAALEQFREALRTRPDSISVNYNLGLAYSDLGRLGDAEAAYRKVIGMDGKNDGAFNNLGILLARQGRTEEAKLAFKAAVDANPGNVAAARNLAAISK